MKQFISNVTNKYVSKNISKQSETISEGAFISQASVSVSSPYRNKSSSSTVKQIKVTYVPVK